MKKSSKIYNLFQAQTYIRAGANIVEIGKDWDEIREKHLFWVRFDIDQFEYKCIKKIWMENNEKT